MKKGWTRRLSPYGLPCEARQWRRQGGGQVMEAGDEAVALHKVRAMGSVRWVDSE